MDYCVNVLLVISTEDGSNPSDYVTTIVCNISLHAFIRCNRTVPGSGFFGKNG